MKILVLLLLISISGLSSLARATEIFEYTETTRGLGMGGVYVFQDTDANSMIQNPAYLCGIRGVRLNAFGLNVGVNNNTYQDYQSNIYKNINSINNLEPLYGSPLWAGIDAQIGLAVPCFGVAGYDNTYTTAELNNPAFPTVHGVFYNDLGMLAGTAIPLGPNLSIGFNAKRISRIGNTNDIGAQTLAQLGKGYQLQDSFNNQGVGYGLDTGLVYKVPNAILNPTLSLAWRDVGCTAFSQTGGAGAPDRIEDNIVLGATFSKQMSLLGIAGGLELRHLVNDGEEIGKKFHAGLELDLAFIELRTGLYQGYATYGAGIDLWIFNVDAAYYTVEQGVYPGQLPDTRYQATISMQLGFDADFNLTDIGGEKRSLKHRR